MERWSWSEYLLIALIVVSDTLRVLTDEAPRNRTQNRNKTERTVIFPVSNETERNLPVFDPIVDYVGRNLHLAPPVDKYGNPLCLKNSEDTFCETVDYYPDNEIRKAIHYSSEEFKELFGSLSVNPRKIPNEVSEETVCPQQSRLFFPKAAVNENEQWAFVVNDVDYVQAVMSEICEKEDKPCTYLDGALPSGISSYCRQKYAYKRLLALHPNQKRTYTDAFKFPSCCVCYIKRPFVLTRTRMIKVEDNKPDQSSQR